MAFMINIRLIHTCGFVRIKFIILQFVSTHIIIYIQRNVKHFSSYIQLYQISSNVMRSKGNFMIKKSIELSEENIIDQENKKIYPH